MIQPWCYSARRIKCCSGIKRAGLHCTYRIHSRAYYRRHYESLRIRTTCTTKCTRRRHGLPLLFLGICRSAPSALGIGVLMHMVPVAGWVHSHTVLRSKTHSAVCRHSIASGDCGMSCVQSPRVLVSIIGTPKPGGMTDNVRNCNDEAPRRMHIYGLYRLAYMHAYRWLFFNGGFKSIFRN